MPPGTVGFNAAGKLTREDSLTVLEPALNEAMTAGEIRMLFRLTDFHGLEPGAWFQDIKTGLGLGVGHHSAWKRSAISHRRRLGGQSVQAVCLDDPGEVAVYNLHQLQEAKTWVSGKAAPA